MAAFSSTINNANTTLQFLGVDNQDSAPAANTLLALTGANTASISFSDTLVDTSSFGDGLVMPQGKTGVQGTCSVGGVVVPGAAQTAYQTLGGDTVAGAGKEAYFLITYGDGATAAFYGLVSNYSEQLDQRDVLRFTSTVTLQSVITRTAAT